MRCRLFQVAKKLSPIPSDFGRVIIRSALSSRTFNDGGTDGEERCKVKKERRKKEEDGNMVVLLNSINTGGKENNKGEQSVVLHAFHRDRTYTLRIFHCIPSENILCSFISSSSSSSFSSEKVCSGNDEIYLHSFLLRGLIFPSFFFFLNFLLLSFLNFPLFSTSTLLERSLTSHFDVPLKALF